MYRYRKPFVTELFLSNQQNNLESVSLQTAKCTWANEMQYFYNVTYIRKVHSMEKLMLYLFHNYAKPVQ